MFDFLGIPFSSGCIFFIYLGMISAVVSTLVNFVRMFVRSHEENCKQLEFEKKRAIKESEKEQSKLKASSKETNNTDIKKDDGDVPNT